MVPNIVAARLERVILYNIAPPPMANSEIYEEMYMYMKLERVNVESKSAMLPLNDLSFMTGRLAKWHVIYSRF